MPLEENVLPKLRTVDTKPFLRGGQLLIAVRDPMRLTDKTILIPQSIAPILALCDGTRDARGLSASLAIRHGLNLSVEEIEQFLTALDEALLLDNVRFAEALNQARLEYLEAPFRPPTLAGGSYPEDPDELKNFLTGYIDAVDGGTTVIDGRGLVSPHIDYERGGPVYAQVWGRAMDFVRAADLAIVFGTDHFSEDNRLTLTRQNYATPFGVLQTAREVVDALAKILGEEAAFAGELLHRGEHSIELAATWMHFIRDGQPCELVPIMCNTFSFFFKDDVAPENDPLIDQLIHVMKSTTAERKVIVVAAGDLSHVGPVFGGYPLDILGRARLQAADDELLERICTGDEQGFFEAIKRVEDANNVCGAIPIYLTMRLLSPVQGERVAYDLCPADEQGTSLVSICGVVFT
jgi:AmmeMemoRadiSam system protein B